MLKLSGRHVHGRDIRDRMPLLPIEEWTRDRMHSSYWLMVKVFERPPMVEFPLGYPNPGDEFYGYANREVELPDGTEVPSTRDLIRVTGWMATAVVAHAAGRYVARKRDCHASYRRFIGDEWAPLIEEIYYLCRGEWGYLVPDEAEGRRRLQAICRRTLEWENHFLRIYKRFLVSELGSSGGQDVDRALWLLGEIPYRDEEVIGAVEALAARSDREDLRGQAELVLRRLHPAAAQYLTS